MLLHQRLISVILTEINKNMSKLNVLNISVSKVLTFFCFGLKMNFKIKDEYWILFFKIRNFAEKLIRADVDLHLKLPHGQKRV